MTACSSESQSEHVCLVPRTTPALKLPDDLLVEIAALLSFGDLLRCTRICSLWRFALNNCATLWRRLDLIYAQDHALVMLPDLLPRTKQAPVDLALKLTSAATVRSLRDLCQLLGHHLFHMRSLAFHSGHPTHYGPLFKSLREPAPILLSLDVSTAGEPFMDHVEPQPAQPDDMLIVAPRLSYVNWGHHVPSPMLSRLASITTLRISPGPVGLMLIFSLFPHLTTLCLDNCYVLRDGIQALPAAHPLQHLELRVRPSKESPSQLRWQSLAAGRLMALPRISVHNYGLSTLFDLLEPYGGAGGALKELTIDYDDRIDAVYRAGEREWRMHGMYGVHGQRANAQSLMHKNGSGLLKQLTSLTISLSARHGRSMFPLGTLPALEKLTILCGKPELLVGGYTPPTLLDSGVLYGEDVLHAPALGEVRLVARPGCKDVIWISPHALGQFFFNHIVVVSEGGYDIRFLRVDEPSVRLDRRKGDVESGCAALRARVGSIQSIS
ncbi:hypothetical protein AURDEDRAFT_123823 [Auricularia subglabra TFB-10046 SS5]|nr:hypothetical protein AURDEDRAFT_123823 [Auricularia subglabra TFB-10046 SS5]